MATSPIAGLVTPDLTAPPNIPSDMAALATQLDSMVQVKIQQITLATNAVITFSSIPQTFTHLRVVGHLRTLVAAATDASGLRLNGDASSVYDYAHIDYNDASTPGFAGVGSGGAATANSIVHATVSGSTATAGYFTQVTIDIPDYTSTAFNKTATGTYSLLNHPLGVFGGSWASTSAISSLAFAASGATYAAGSTLSLYGIP